MPLKKYNSTALYKLLLWLQVMYVFCFLFLFVFLCPIYELRNFRESEKISRFAPSICPAGEDAEGLLRRHAEPFPMEGSFLSVFVRCCFGAFVIAVLVVFS